MAESDIREYFEHDGNRRLTEILTALFPDNDTIYPEDIYPERLAVFCTLLKISKGRWIEHFKQYDTLNDTKLPFNPDNPPADWPKAPEYPNFLQKFCEEQWAFCVPIMRRPFVERRFHENQVLPIVFKKALGTGSSANLWRIKLHPAHNQLITDDDKRKLGDDADTFVIKEYFTSDAEKYYKAEVNAFRQLQRAGRHGLPSTSSIIGFRGSFTRGNSFNVILEFADRGSLEEYFKTVWPPADGEQIIQFWEALSDILTALMKIHNVKPDDAGGGRTILGWHQDVKPANILVVSNGSIDPCEWQFKLADLGGSHFNRADQLRRGSTATNRQGTRTYGAPECCSPGDISENEQLRVGQNVDIWSLGCIYSEAARWLKYGYQGILDYQRERSDEIGRIADFEDADCFHNGEKALEAVKKSHQTSTSNLRPEDFITKPVVEQMVREMLQDSVARPSARVLAYKSKQLLTEARKNLADMNSPPSPPSLDRRTGPKRVQTVPAFRSSPPPPPKLPPSEGAFPGSTFPSVMMPQTPDRNPSLHLMRPDIPTPTSLPDEGDQQSNSPDEMTDLDDDNDTPTKQPATYTSQRRAQLRSTQRGSVHGSLHLRKRGHQPTDSEEEMAMEQSVQSDTSDVANPAGNGTPVSNGRPRNGRSTGLGVGWMPSGTNRTCVPPNAGHGSNSLANRQKFPDGPLHRRGDSNNPLSFLSLPSGERSSSMYENKYRPAVPPIAVEREGAAAIPSTAPPATWTIQEALEWKKEYKETRKRFPNPDLLRRLKGRDHVFVIDDSAGMEPHWKYLISVFEALSYVVKTVDPNGLDLHFTVSDDKYLNRKETAPLIKTVRSQPRRSTTDMNIRLTTLLQAYQNKLSKKKSRFSSEVKPMNLYILTDGVWETETNVEAPIRSLVKTLNEQGMGRLQIGIQFIYFGNNPNALERLEHLDSGLGLDLDIVDHESAAGNVWKMLFGSTNATFDSVDEVRYSVVSTPTDRGRSPAMSNKEYDN